MKHRATIALGLGLALAALTPAGAQQSHGGRGIERMDADKDGKVSREEWIAYYTERFTTTDANGDGFITEKEMAASRGSRGGSSSRSGSGSRGGRSGGGEEHDE